MDNREISGENFVVSVPSSLGNVDGIGRQDPVTPTPMRKIWARVSTASIGVVRHTLMPLSLLIMGLVLLPLRGLGFFALTRKGGFILSCVAVSFDSLFLYIPIINQENKCLGSDKTLRNVALVLRSYTDIASIFHMIILISDKMDEDHEWDDSNSDFNYPAIALRLPRALKLVQEAIAKKIPWLSIPIIVNFLAILPVPQVAIVFGFFRLGGSKHFLKQTILNVFLVFQYFLRIFQIFLSIEKVGDTVGKLVKGSFYFLLYIIASYVFAAFWYFFSIQREISCWVQACRTIAGCMPIYECGHSTSLNSTFVNKLCHVESRNATSFDFGMFRDILESGITRSTNFSTKFLYSFWWGLKNLSNFGTNLETSSYIWENCFAILICIIGLLLFLVLIGNVQTYIQSESERFVKIRESIQMKIDTKHEDIEKWMSSHGLLDDMKIDIRKKIGKYQLVDSFNKFLPKLNVMFIDEDVDVLFMARYTGRCDVKSDPIRFFGVKALKKIPILRNLDEQDLEMFASVTRSGCYQDHITIRGEDDYIAGARRRLDSMYLIIDGVIECKDPETMSTQIMRRYDCCGEEVLLWAILNYKKEHRDPLPISTVDVKCQTKTEAFKFTADDLIEILKKLNNSEQLEALAHDSSTERRIEEWLLRNGFPQDLRTNIMNCLDKTNLLAGGNMDADVDVDFLFSIFPENIKPSIKRRLGMKALKKVPMLQKMHEYVLEIICNHLEIKVYEKDSFIVRAEEQLGLMIFILGGKIIMTDTTSSNASTRSSSEITEPSDENVLERGGYYGEQLLSWASLNNISSSDNPVISTRDVKCETKVEALILKAEDLESAVSKCGSQWNFNSCMDSQQVVDDGRDHVVNPAPMSTIEETIRLHQGHDMIFRRLDDIVRRLDDQGQRLDNQGRRLDEMAAFLARLECLGTYPPAAGP